MTADQDLRDAIRAIRIELRIVNDKVAMSAGLNPRDLDILDVIDRDGPCTPSHLAERTGYHRATLTGILARLEREGWVGKSTAETDRRSHTLTASERFVELRALYAPVDRHAAALAEQLSTAERTTVIDTLKRMVAIARAASEEIGS